MAPYRIGSSPSAWHRTHYSLRDNVRRYKLDGSGTFAPVGASGLAILGAPGTPFQLLCYDANKRMCRKLSRAPSSHCTIEHACAMKLL
jgi:hypothetical protein